MMKLVRMSAAVQKFGLSVSTKHGVFILRLCHKDSKTKCFQLNGSSSQAAMYVEPKVLPLPLNFRDLASTERSAFSKERTRDTLGTYLAASSGSSYIRDKHSYESDLRAEIYSCSASVDLSSSMQTNVPQPFKADVRFTHLNMPRGQWRQEAKYISEQLNNFHHMNSRHPISFTSVQSKCFFSSEKKSSESDELAQRPEAAAPGQNQKLTTRQKLKAAVNEYGITILVLHISLSLVSLGMCYTLIQCGINLEDILKQKTDGAGVVSTAGPFIVAYAVHKVLAPFRVGLTLTLTPFVVHFLRKRGFRVKGKIIKGS